MRDYGHIMLLVNFKEVIVANDDVPIRGRLCETDTYPFDFQVTF